MKLCHNKNIQSKLWLSWLQEWTKIKAEVSEAHAKNIFLFIRNEKYYHLLDI